MAKKSIGKALLFSALIGSAVAGGIALYKKFIEPVDELDDDFLDFDDEDFDDEEFNSDFDVFDDVDDDEEESVATESSDETKEEDKQVEDEAQEEDKKSYVSIPIEEDYDDEAEDTVNSLE